MSGSLGSRHFQILKIFWPLLCPDYPWLCVRMFTMWIFGYILMLKLHSHWLGTFRCLRVLKVKFLSTEYSNSLFDQRLFSLVWIFIVTKVSKNGYSNFLNGSIDDNAIFSQTRTSNLQLATDEQNLLLVLSSELPSNLLTDFPFQAKRLIAS